MVLFLRKNDDQAPIRKNSKHWMANNEEVCILQVQQLPPRGKQRSSYGILGNPFEDRGRDPSWWPFCFLVLDEQKTQQNTQENSIFHTLMTHMAARKPRHGNSNGKRRFIFFFLVWDWYITVKIQLIPF